MKKSLVFIILGLCTILSLRAQNNCCDRWSVGTNFMLKQPLGDMASNGFQTGYAITFSAFYNLTPELQKMNFHLGGRITGGLTGGKRDRIQLESPAVAAKSKLYNTFADMVFTGRVVFQPDRKIQPYFDLYGGGRATGANHDLRLTRSVSGYDRRTSERVANYINWTWGTGAGMLIHLRENVYLDFGVNYMRSQGNEFVDFDSYAVKNDIIEYEVVNSISNSVGFHIGFHVALDCSRDYSFRRDNRRERRRGGWIRSRGGSKPKMKRAPVQKN